MAEPRREELAAGNPVLQLLENRTTLRKYADRPVPKEVEDAVIHAAMRAPTASNMMYYSILVIRDRELRRRLQVTCNNQRYITQAPLMLVFCADYQRWQDLYERDRVPEKCAELGVPFLPPSENRLMLCAMDAALAAQNAVIAAESLGLGSCYIGHIVDHYEEHRLLLNLPPLVFPVTALLLGYPHESVRKIKTPRYDRKYIVHEDRYRRIGPGELDEMHTGRLGCPPGNRYGAENIGQYLYLRKYAYSACYPEGARSVRAALRNWRTEE